MNFKSQRSADFRRSIWYVLRDKDGADTDERVGFVQLRNLATDDPAAEMLVTVAAARALQARNRIEKGQRAAASGASPKDPCYTFSLAWHPLDNPSQKKMLATAHRALAELGLSQHQAVIAQHVDRGHPHLHVVVNLLNPRTGQIANLNRDIWRMNNFCHQMELENGVIRSFMRAAKIEQLPKSPRRESAQKKAKDIQAERKTARLALMQKQQTAHDQRRKESEQVWTDYRAGKQAVYDRYKSMFDELWSRSKPEITKTLEPSRSFFAPKREWMKLAEALKPLDWVSPRIRRTFRQADQAYVPHNTPNETSRNFQWSQDAQTKDDLRPLQRGAPQLRGGKVIQPGRPWLNRRERSGQLKLARSAELSELALSHQRRVEALEKADIAAQKGNGEEWKTFKSETAKIWANHKAEFAAPAQQKETEKEAVKEDFDNSKGLNSTDLNASVGAHQPIAEKHQLDGEKHQSMTIQQYADDYISGKGRDSKEHEQFAANNAPAIEKEFQSRKDAEKPRNRYVQMSVADAQAEFGQFIRECGVDLKEPPIMDGQWHSAPLIGQKGGKKSASYMGFTDNHKNGVVSNHRDGTKFKWPDISRTPLTPELRAKYERQQGANQTQRNAQITARQDDAAKTARLIWDQCQPASQDHAYLVKKGISPHGIRQCRSDVFMPRTDPSKPGVNLNRTLIVPRYDMAGRLRSIQAISPSGFKMYQSHGQTRGTSYVIGRIDPSRAVIVAEGFATAATIHAATGLAVAVAFDSGGLKSVATALRERFPEQKIIIAADKDSWSFSAEGYEAAGRPEKDNIAGNDPRWEQWREAGFLKNVGVEAAQEAAEAVNAEVITPDIPVDHADKITDFNDVASYYSLEPVASAFSDYTATSEISGWEMEHSGMDYGM